MNPQQTTVRERFWNTVPNSYRAGAAVVGGLDLDQRFWDLPAYCAAGQLVSELLTQAAVNATEQLAAGDSTVAAESVAETTIRACDAIAR